MKRFSVQLNICVIFSLAIIFFPLSAQTVAHDIFNHPLNTNDISQFVEICSDLSSHPIVRGSFSQKKTIARLNRSLLSEGDFIIDNVLGIVWDTKKPFPSIMAVGKDFMVQSIPNGTKTKMDAQGNETFLQMSDTISAVFKGDSQKLLDNFDNYFVGDKNSWTLGLVPKNAAVRLFASQIIMSGDSVIRSIVLFEANGDTIQYDLSNHTFPGALSADEKNLFSL
jgi:outer membrane lipoprotein-sorting protein